MFKSLVNCYYRLKKRLYRRYFFYRIKFTYISKINKLYNYVMKNTADYKADPVQVKEHIKRWKMLDKHVNTRWFKVYAGISGVNDPNYVPEDIYYGIIEPVLNDFETAKTYADKNFYDHYYSDLDILPKTFFRNINGVFYKGNYALLNVEDDFHIEDLFDNNEKVLLKPTLETGAGHNVQVFCRRDNNEYFNKHNEKLTLDYLKDKYKKNYLIQECVENPDYFKCLNETSLNTFRVFTYRSVLTNEVAILSCVLRMGGKGAEVDNEMSGGVPCYVNDKGELDKFAIDKNGQKYYSSPTNPDAKFSDFGVIPKFDKLMEVVKKVAERNYYHRLLAFDICIDKNENIKLIEVNNQGCGINLLQRPGCSLFGEYTDEIINYVYEKHFKE